MDNSVTQKSRLSPPLLLMAHSEKEFQGELDVAAEAGAADHAEGRRAEGTTRCTKRRGIGEIEGLGAKLQVQPFSRNELAMNGEIERLAARRVQHVAPQ